MIDWPTAHTIARAHVAGITITTPDDEVVVDDSRTRAYDFGWLFHYQSRRFLETGDEQWMVFDTPALLVHRSDGRIIPLHRVDREAELARIAQEWAANPPVA